MRKILILSAAVIMAVSCAESMDSLADRVFTAAQQQYELMHSNTAEGFYPRTFQNGEFVDTPAANWTSGFYPGALWYIYEYSSDETVREMADAYTRNLDTLYTCPFTNHDIGFQIQCSYLNGYRLTGNEDYLKFIELNADKLAKRFSPITGCIKSWDNDTWEFPVIIDNMMNLELLMVAAEMFNADSLITVAQTHANTTMANHFRDDYSCCHLVDYSIEDGSVLLKQTVQGLADDSSWARGQAWAIYGYAMMAQKCKDQELATAYLTHAENIAGMLLKRLPKDGVPYWDFDSNDIPDDVMDSSAAAIMASGFVTLAELTADKSLAKKCMKMAETQIRSLASEMYFSKIGENGGFLLMHGTGNKPSGREIDTPLIYGDYYFLEAILKYLKY